MSTPFAILSALFDHIERNAQEPLSLAELSQSSGLSAFQLIRLFDRFTGLTPMAYVRARRLALSMPQLLRGDSVLRVALDWGFEYEQSYIRAFRESFGTTPARFRRQHMDAQIIGVPRLGELTVSASGMLGQPKLLVRPAFALVGEERTYDYKDNLLLGTPLMDGIRAAQGAVCVAACRPVSGPGFEHRYLMGREGTSGACWSYPAGQWAQFDYSGLHALDERGAQRIRLLMALVIGGWFKENGLFWDGGFIETVDLSKCATDYCEVRFQCCVAGLEDASLAHRERST